MKEELGDSEEGEKFVTAAEGGMLEADGWWVINLEEEGGHMRIWGAREGSVGHVWE
jgi:hypothetical protein